MKMSETNTKRTDCISNEVFELKNYVEEMEIDSDIKELLLSKMNVIELEIQKEAKEKKAIEEQSMINEQKCCFYESSIEALPNPVFIKNGQGECVFFNTAYQEYFGVEREQYLGKTVLELEFLPMEERERYQCEDLKLIETGNVKHYEMDFEIAGGEIGHSLYWSKGFEVSTGNERGLVGEIVDISDMKKLQREISCRENQLREANLQIKKMMSRDYLTGLYNRRVMEDCIQRIDNIVAEGISNISLVMADLDNFKKVNDTFGHFAGDEVLVEFSKILTVSSRRDDLVVRFGGEEFLIVLFDTQIKEAWDIAEKIRTATEQQLLLPDGNRNTVSLGVSEISEGENFAAALKRADDALYCAKKTGRNRVVVK